MADLGQTFDPSPDLLKTLGPIGLRGKIWIAFLLVVAITGWIAYAHQAVVGLAATAMNDYFSWGIYIVNFVFFIGISMAGTLISALLRLTHAPWRHPITRLAEAITLFSLMIAGPMIIIDMGRPDRFLYVLLYGRVQSPILWDVMSLTTYMFGSLLFLYLPMIPDMAILRDCNLTFAPWRRWMYRTLAIGWRNTPQQQKILNRGINVIAIVIIPVAVSIHTVTAWLFGMTLRPGWHTTIIGPDFVVGALYSGLAAVITAIVVFRSALGLHKYITIDHLSKLSRLLLIFAFCYAYFVINEHVGSTYTNESIDRGLDTAIFTGQYAKEFWAMVIFGLALPVILLVLPTRRHMTGILTASLLVNVGMWLKRYIIVVPTLASPIMPTIPGDQKLYYVPTITEWLITAGAFAGFCFMYTVFAKLFPIVSIWESAEHEAPTPAPVAPKSAAPRLGLATAVIAVALLTITRPAAAAAPATEPTTQPQLQVTLDRSNEDNTLQLIATVTSDGKPFQNAKVTFNVARQFGNMVVGNDTTLDDGTAAAPYPADLPGDGTGQLRFLAEAVASPGLAPAIGRKSFPATVLAAPSQDVRALWSSRAPVSLMVSIVIVVGSVWATYAYVVLQLLQIKKAGVVP